MRRRLQRSEPGVKHTVLTLSLSFLLAVSACSDESPSTEAPSTADSAATTTVTTVPATTSSSTAAPATIDETETMAVVLLNPSEPDSLNVREQAGTANPVVGTLHPTQTGLLATGGQETIDGWTWYEIVTEETAGWVHGRYLTRTWTLEETETEWDWESTLD